MARKREDSDSRKTGYADRLGYMFEALEPRLLMSADPIGLSVTGGLVLDVLEPQPSAGLEALHTPDALLEGPAAQPQAADTVEPDSPARSPVGMDLAALADLSSSRAKPSEGGAENAREVLFVDPQVSGYEQLLERLSAAGRELQVFVLDPARDGIAQIGEVLAAHEGVDTVHIVSHGSQAGIQLGSTWLTGESLPEHARDIEAWRAALNAGADLLIYGCDLAAGEEGRTLARSLGELTGADVAASEDATGHASLGGDWVLEYARGPIESPVAFDMQTQQAWLGLLGDSDPLWLTANNDVPASNGVPGMDGVAWQQGDVLAMSGPPTFGPGTTSGAFSMAFDMESFAPGANVDALHYVTGAITVGNTVTMDLQPGDLLLSTDANQTLVSNGASPLPDLDVQKQDVFVFRPDTPGDYSQGNFFMLLQDPGGHDIRAISLVERNTVVGDVVLDRGDFLFSGSSAAEDQDIWLFQTDNVEDADTGSSTTSGTAVQLLAGNDPLVGIDQAIVGLELVESATTLGGVNLAAGTILAKVDAADTVGSNGLSVTEHNIFALSVAHATSGSTSTGEATASLFFDNGLVGLDSSAEMIDGFTLTVDNGANQPPVFTAAGPFSVDENAPSGTMVGTVEASDPDIPGVGSTLTISEIMFDPASGEPDWEWIEVYNPTSATIDLTGYVLDDANTVAHSAANIASGSIAPGTTAVLFNADALSSADFEAAWGSGINLIPVTDWANLPLNNDGDKLSLWASLADYAGDNETHANAQVTVGYEDLAPWPAPDGAGSIFLTDLSADPSDGSNWALSTDGAVTPLGGTAFQSTAAAGNTGADVGSPGDGPASAVTYAITGNVNPDGDADLAFSIDPNTGVITVNDPGDLNYGATPSLAITVRADDGEDQTSTSVTIDVNYVNKAPTITSPAGYGVNEDDGPQGIGGISVADADAGSGELALTLSVANGTLDLGSTTGLTLTAGAYGSATITVTGTVADLNAALGTLSYRPHPDFYGVDILNLSLDDQGNTGSGGPLTNSHNVTISVAGVNDPPAGISLSSSTEDEHTDTTGGHTVGTLTTSDADASDTFSYSLAGGADAGVFAIGGVGGDELILDNGILDYEAQASYQVMVRVTDAGGLTHDETFTISVNDLNDAPVITSGTAVSIAENAMAVMTVTATDQDVPANTLTYGIAGGADQARFSIDPVSGALTFDTAPDFESPVDADSNNVYEVQVQVDDGNGGSDIRTVNVTVTGVSENPVASDDSYTVDEDTTLDSGDTWFGSAWSSRRRLSFDNAAQTEDLTDFPVLIALDASRIDYSQTQDNGQDLRFVDGDGTVLAHEIEAWNESGTSYVWVRVPQVDGGSDTDFIWMYYGNPAAPDGQNAANVWDANYKAVWHLSESGNGTADEYVDSTANANHGQGGGGVAGDTPTQVAGKIGNAQAFDETTEFVAIPKVENDVDVTKGTISAWLTLDPTSTYSVAFELRANPSNLISLWWDDLQGEFQFLYKASGARSEVTTAAISEDSAWHFVTLTWDTAADEARAYLDGGQIGGTQTGLGTWVGVFNGDGSIGAQPTPFHTFNWDGIIDEARISDVARSVDWIAAQYASMSGTLVNYGYEQGVAGVLGNDGDGDGDPLTAVLVTGPANAAAFSLNADGSFTYTPNVDFCGVDSFTYVANDGTSASNVATVTLTVTPVNDPPTTTGIGNVVVDEDAPDTVIDLFGAFADVEDLDAVLSYALAANTNPGLFTSLAIDGLAGTLTLGYAPDQNGTADITVRATDAGGQLVETSFTVTVNPINDAPTAVSLSSAPVDELTDTAGGYSVGTLTTIDADASDTFSYSIVGGADAGVFAIGGVGGNELILDDGILDYEAQASYQVMVRVTDAGGLSHDETFTILVNDLNEVPVFTSAPMASVSENFTGTLHTVTATDEDGDIPTFSIIGGADAGRFYIDNTTGELRFTVPPDFEAPGDAGGDNVYLVRVQADDGRGGTAVQPVAVAVTNLNEAPVTVGVSNASLPDNTDTTGGYSVGTLSAVDPDAGDTVTYTVVGGADAAHFTIGGAGGDELILSDGTLDYEAQSAYQVIVRAADAAGLSHDQSLTITVIEAAGNEPAAPPVAPGLLDGTGPDLPPVEVPEVTPPDPPSGPDQTPDTSEASDSGSGSGETDPGAGSGTGAGAADFTEDEPESPTLPPSEEDMAAVIIGGDGKPAARSAWGTTLAPPIKAASIGLLAFEPVAPAALEVAGLGESTLSLDDLQALMDTGGFRDGLDGLREDVARDVRFDKTVVGSTIVASTSLSVGYVLWLVRGGVLLSSVLSSMPAWRLIDPLPVLAYARERSEEEGEDESLEALVKERGDSAETVREEGGTEDARAGEQPAA